MTDTDEGDERIAPHGWEVEYLGGGGNISQTNHPGAESVMLQATVAGAQSQPALVLYDVEEEEIAFYSSLAWLACRRNARPPDPSQVGPHGPIPPTRPSPTRSVL